MASFVPAGGGGGGTPTLTSGQIGLGDSNNQLSGSPNLTSDGQSVKLNSTISGSTQTVLNLDQGASTGGVPDALVQGLNVLVINGTKLKFQVGGGTGSAGQVMTADGAGYAAWANPSGGGGSSQITSTWGGVQPIGNLANSATGSVSGKWHTQIGHDNFGYISSSGVQSQVYNNLQYLSPFWNLSLQDRNPNYWDWKFVMYDAGNALNNNVGLCLGIYEDTSGDGWPDTLICSKAVNLATNQPSSAGNLLVEMTGDWQASNGTSTFSGTLSSRKQYFLAHNTWGANYSLLRYRTLSPAEPSTNLGKMVNGGLTVSTPSLFTSGNKMPVMKTQGSNQTPFNPQGARANLITSPGVSDFFQMNQYDAGKNKNIWMEWKSL